jgi:glycoside/pentoside/hexuronide:cation symporter, GPH family
MLAVFCLPNVIFGLSITAMSVVMPAFYAKFTAASLAAIGTGLFLARIIEAVSDPLIGYASDLTRCRWGPRKPWLLAGAVLAPLCTYAFFLPAADAGGLYFGIWCVLLYLAWTLISIPYRAWGVELSREYSERARIFTWMGMAQGLGATGFALILMVPAFSSGDVNPQTVGRIGWMLILLFPATILLALWRVPAGAVLKTERPTLGGLLRAVSQNIPLRWFMIAYFVGQMAQGAVLALFFFFIDQHLGLAEVFPLALLAVYVCGLVAMPAWLWLIERLSSKHQVWALGWGGAGLLTIALLYIPRDGLGTWPLLILLGLYGACIAVELILPFAVLGDVIDYDTWRTRVNRAGNYNAFGVLCMKAGLAVGGALALWLLDFFDYQVSGAANTPGAERGFLLTFIGLPAFLYAVSALLLWRFPITRSRQEIIRRRLVSRESRA